MIPRLLCSTLLLPLLLAPLEARAARLEVFPREVSAKPGDALRFVAVLWSGPAGKEQASLAPLLTWSAEGGAISRDGEVKLPAQGGSPAVVITARVGGLKATARISVRFTDLQVLPQQVRVLVGKPLRLTALDRRGGGARTPAKAVWSADRGTIDATGTYTAPGVPGPDTVRVTVGKRTAIAQVLVQSVPAGSAHTDPTAGATPAKPGDPKARPPKTEPIPPPVVPMRVKSWRRSGGLNSRHSVEVEVLAPEASHLKLMGRTRTGAVTTLASRRVKAGEVVTLATTVSTSWREVELQLLDAQGRSLSVQRRLR